MFAVISIPLFEVWTDVQRGYSVKQAKADVVRDYYGGVEPSRPTTSSPSFTQIAPSCCRKKSLVFPGSQSPLTAERPFRSNGPLQGYY